MSLESKPRRCWFLAESHTFCIMALGFLSVEGIIWCLCLNARSIKNIFLEVEAANDIVVITEIWLGEEGGDEYNIEGYKLFRKDRSSE